MDYIPYSKCKFLLYIIGKLSLIKTFSNTEFLIYNSEGL